MDIVEKNWFGVVGAPSSHILAVVLVPGARLRGLWGCPRRSSPYVTIVGHRQEGGDPSVPPVQPSHAIQEVGKRLFILCLGGEHPSTDSAWVLCLRGRGSGQVPTLIQDLLSVGVVVGHSLGLNFSHYRHGAGRFQGHSGQSGDWQRGRSICLTLGRKIDLQTNNSTIIIK